MTDPNYAHEFWPNRRGICKTIVSGKLCHQGPQTAVHTRYVPPPSAAEDLAQEIFEMVRPMLDAEQDGQIRAIISRYNIERKP